MPEASSNIPNVKFYLISGGNTEYKDLPPLFTYNTKTMTKRDPVCLGKRFSKLAFILLEHLNGSFFNIRFVQWPIKFSLQF